MTKRQIIDDIIASNHSASPEFLAQFDKIDLMQYLRHLEVLRTPRLTGDASRYQHYFRVQQVDHVDDLSVLVPAEAEAAAKCPAAVVSPVDADLVDRDEFDADLLSLVEDMAGHTPADPRAETMEFEPIFLSEEAELGSADYLVSASADLATADPAPGVYESETDLVAVQAQADEGFDDQQESWLF